MRRRLACLLPTFALALLADRVTKAMALDALGALPTRSAPFLDGFLRFYLVFNTGAAFSLLDGSRVLLIVLSSLVVVATLVYACVSRSAGFIARVGLTLVSAGGLGNLIDRLLYGAVVDFLMFDFIRFPVFNVADCAVTAGVGLVIIGILRTGGRACADAND